MGENDIETFSNICRASYDFDDDAFDAVSQEARDFISGLLIHRKEDRMSAIQCLESTWLSQHNDLMSNVKLSTDKLKKFIIRRKWQVGFSCFFEVMLFYVCLLLIGGLEIWFFVYFIGFSSSRRVRNKIYSSTH